MPGRLTLSVAILVVALGAIASSSAIGAAGGPAQIDIAGAPQGGNPEGGGGRFTLRAGATRDSGTNSYSFSFPGSGKSSAGQTFARVKGTIYLNGTKGQLVLSVKGQSYGAAGDGAVSGRDVWTGTWTVVSGTETYAGTRGGGAFVGIAGPTARVVLRLHGHLR